MSTALLLCAAGRSAHPAEPCLWMNAATAGGILGGTVTAQDSGHGSCAFQRPGAQLRIEVVAAEGPGHFARLAASCGSKAMPLKAIGNEAVVCVAADNAERAAHVVGRVRDRVFTIAIESSDASLTEQGLREKARAAAEQVAGNLF